MLGRIIFGLAGIIIGTLIIIYTDWIVRNFGRSAWAEAHLRTSGGSRTFYKLIGLAIILIALMGSTGILQSLLLSFFGNLFGGFR
jgi:hypothetical protein